MGAWTSRFILAAMASSAFLRCGRKIRGSPLISSRSKEPPASICDRACSTAASGIPSSFTAATFRFGRGRAQ